jgi:hypothetical protein
MDKKKLTLTDIGTADPRKLVDALHCECDVAMSLRSWGSTREMAGVYALASMLDETTAWQDTMAVAQMEMTRQVGEQIINTHIRAAARAWLKAGGTLEVTE